MDPIRLERDPDGIAWVVFDTPESKVNVFNPPVMERLTLTLEQLLRDRPRGVVFISGKPGTFIAGADIKELEKIRDKTHGAELSRAGHRIFGMIEQLNVPTVAAINGACLGGGYELALACRYRVATDDAKTTIGLPETQLGIIPGWGGTQRLPRLIGLQAALGIILPGQTVDANRAFKLGMVDAVVPAVALRDTAREFASGNRAVKRRSFKLQHRWPMRELICSQARKQTLARTKGHYPAPLMALDVVEEGLSAQTLDEALEREAQGFAEGAPTLACKNLIRVFFLKERYSKLTVDGTSRGDPSRAVGKVGVLGAGVMGAGIAQWCSSRGLTVRLKDIKPEYVAAGIQRIAAAYREGVKRHKLTALRAQHGLARVHPTTDYTGFQDCDMVIEAVLEKLAVKRDVYAQLAPRLSAACILASNTSAIPIDELAAASGRPDKFIGIHFFNPVHKMPLVEVVRGTHTSKPTLIAAVEFVKQLKKIPVVVNGSPGFLVNRLLMPYLNEAGKMVEEGIGVTAIDSAMVAFGMPMGPLRLIDEVGIDVAYDVASELAEAFRGRMIVAPLLGKLHEEGLKGRKSGRGFYVYDGKQEAVNPRVKGQSQQASAAVIQDRLLKVMIDEAKLCLAENVVAHQDDVDAAMIFGTGFPPFRGGLVKYAVDAGRW